MNDNRIRLDLKAAGKASITKSSVVAAVRLLEQDTGLELLKSSQEIANWITLHLTATHQDGNVRICITWVEDPKTSVDGIVNPVHNVDCSLELTDTILRALKFQLEGKVSEVLPILLARLIKDTPLVNKVEQDIDSFL